MASVRFDMDNAGIREIARSAGMQAALKQTAEGLAAKANSDARSHSGWLASGEFETDPYAAGVDVLRGTAVGYATTKTSAGAANETRYKSLSNTNH